MGEGCEGEGRKEGWGKSMKVRQGRDRGGGEAWIGKETWGRIVGN